MDMVVGIVGCGLIGSSIGRGLEGKDGYRVVVFDTNRKVVERAMEDGVCQEGYTTLDKVGLCDLVIFATPPQVTLELINSCDYKDGAVVSDVCGVKNFLPLIREDIDFIGMHPMAGKEVSGYANGDSTIFKGANLLLVKRRNTSSKATDMAEALAKTLGFGVVRYVDRETHDKMIGFTSQMPHLLSSIIVRNRLYEGCHDFEGGSLNDFTRIARLDANMWAELFYQNKGNLKEECDYYIKELRRFKEMLDNREAMEAYMQVAHNNRVAHEEEE